ncbi:MAG TPA: glutamine--fructose-6-phosphate aminotransferase, partial [Bacteroidia bacterium]|nr:glutamine--fructose-6-phosphate aminotransferase [Bacteroidia bacterium]
MCGIVGYIGKQKASAIILEGLKRLEYRGYDSAGVATQSEGRFSLAKKIGRVDGLIKTTPALKLPGTTGIGHTR